MAKVFLIKSEDDDAVYLVDVEQKTVQRLDDDQVAEAGLTAGDPMVQGVSVAIAAQSLAGPVSRKYFEN